MEMNEKQKKSKKWIIAVVLAVILLSSSATIFFNWDKLKSMEIFKKEEIQLSYEVGQIVVNLSDTGVTRYLKTKIVLGYYDDKNNEKIEEKQHEIKDIVVRSLRSKTVSEISSVENTDKLKNELITKLNQIFDETIITDVYITDFMIQ